MLRTMIACKFNIEITHVVIFLPVAIVLYIIRTEIETTYQPCFATILFVAVDCFTFTRKRESHKYSEARCYSFIVKNF